MFLHVKSPLFKKNAADVVIRISTICTLDIIKKEKEGKEIFGFKIYSQHVNAAEIYETLESAKNRMAEVLIMCGEPEENAKAIAAAFSPEDKTKKNKTDEISVDLKKALIDALF